MGDLQIRDQNREKLQKEYPTLQRHRTVCAKQFLAEI